MNRKKGVLIGLVVLLLALQYQLWFSDGGILRMWQLRQQYQKQDAEARRLAKRNQALLLEVKAIQANKQSVEAEARYQLGMVEKGEEFYQIVQTSEKAAANENTD